VVLGTLIAKLKEGRVNNPFSFSSRILSNAKKNYTTIECKVFANIYAIKNFIHYPLGTSFKFIIDHSNIK